MKKLLAVLLVLVFSLAMMTGCGKKEESAPGEGEDFVEGVANPVQTYEDISGQIDAVGIGLEAPEGAKDVIYQSIQSMAQTQFTLDGVSYCYRAEATDELETYDISGLNYEMEESTGSVQGRDAKIMICDEAGAIMWLDVVPGVNYCLGAASAVDADTLAKVAEEIFVPLQGEAK